MKIVGFVGLKGSGKNTAGYYFKQNGYFQTSYAESLKDCLSVVFGWDRELLEGDTEESRLWREQEDTWWSNKLNWKNNPLSHYGPFTPRIALQVVGTDIFRNILSDNLWISSLEYKIKNKQKVVITDCRFENEYNVIKNNNGILYRIKRGPDPIWFECAKETLKNGIFFMKDYPDIHISEWGWVNLPYITITNNGTLNDLYDQFK